MIFDVYRDSCVHYKIKPEAGLVQKWQNRSIGKVRADQEKNSHTSFELLIWMHSCLSSWGFVYRGVTEPSHKEIWNLKGKGICPVMGLLNLPYHSCLGRYLGNVLWWPQALRCWFPYSSDFLVSLQLAQLHIWQCWWQAAHVQCFIIQFPGREDWSTQTAFSLPLHEFSLFRVNVLILLLAELEDSWFFHTSRANS